MRSTTGSATPKRAAISRQMRRSLACRRTRKPAGKAPRTMLGARCTKYQLEPAPLPRVSISLSSGNPWACANAMASATASMMPAHMIWLVALAFAHAQGLPLDKLIDTLGKGAGSSWYFVHRAPNMVRGAFPAGFRVRLHAKDLRICREMAARFGVALPVVERMLAEYAELVARGYGDEDISATYRLKAELFERTNIMVPPRDT